MAQFWAVIQLILKVFNIFSWLSDRYKEFKIEQLKKKDLARNEAIEASKLATTDEEIFKTQHDIVKNRP